MSRRGRASPIALSAQASANTKRDRESNAHDGRTDILVPKRPRTQQLYREDKANHPSDIALTAANMAAGMAYGGGGGQAASSVNVSSVSNGNSGGNVSVNVNVPSGVSHRMNTRSSNKFPSTSSYEDTNTNTSNNTNTSSNNKIHLTRRSQQQRPLSSVFRGASMATSANLKKASNRLAAALAESDDEDDVTANTHLGGGTNVNVNVDVDEDDEYTPQRILLSLKTPPASFDERDKMGMARRTAAILKSAEEGMISPPQIQNSHRTNTTAAATGPQQLLNTNAHHTAAGVGNSSHGGAGQLHHHHNAFASPSSLFFEPSPRSSGTALANPLTPSMNMIDMAPSFSLFNPPSFDSLGECGVGSLDAVSMLNSFSMTGVGEGNCSNGSVTFSPRYHHHLGGSNSNSNTHNNNTTTSNNNNNSSSNTTAFYSNQAVPPGASMPFFMNKASQGGGGSASIIGPNLSFGMGSIGPSPNNSFGMPRIQDSGNSNSVHINVNKGNNSNNSSNNSNSLSCLAPNTPVISAPMASNSTSNSTSAPALAPAELSIPMPYDLPQFYAVLIQFKQAFSDFTFLLPGLKKALQQQDGDDSSSKVHDDSSSGCGASEIPAQDMVIAKRRIRSAVCAFGGGCLREKERKSVMNGTSKSTEIGSAFSAATEDEQDNDDCSGNNNNSPAEKERIHYDRALIKRFQESDAPEGRLSWDVEEHPPVALASPTPERRNAVKSSNSNHSTPSRNNSNNNTNSNSNSSSYEDGESSTSEDEVKQHQRNSTSTATATATATAAKDKDKSTSTPSRSINTATATAQQQMISTSTSTPNNKGKHNNTKGTPAASNSNSNTQSQSQPKMRYRCKLCGLPKQNHVCRFNQTLQRSIGAQVYPAINAYTSHEPGVLAQSLLDMSMNASHAGAANLASHTADENSPDRISSNIPTSSSLKKEDDGTIPNDMNTGTGTGTGTVPPSTPFNASTTRHSIRMNKVTPETPNPVAVLSNVNQQKQQHHHGLAFSSPVLSHANAQQNQRDVLFVDMVDLKPECHRIVTPTTSTSASTSSSHAYCYPKLPLAYVQRKRLSDYLFSLTKEKEGLTDETAAILRDGRENDSDYWDVCIAELLTQVIVVLHCSSGCKPLHCNVGKMSNSNSNSNENSNAKDTAPSSSTAVTDHNRLGGLSRFLLQIGIAC